MTVPTPSSSFRANGFALPPDQSRAVRATIAFMVPLLLTISGTLPLNPAYAAITAQNIAMVDVRGDYRFRMGLLVAMSGVFVGMAALGTVVAHHLWPSLLAALLVVVAGSTWRHLSSDYGPGLAISSSFVFLFGLATPVGHPAVGAHCLATLVGAAWGLVVQVAAWPLQPQHPLRRAVADTWVAVAELCDALAADARSLADRHALLVAKENEVRTTVDQAYAALKVGRSSAVRHALEAVNLAAARVAMRVTALNTALEPLDAEPAAAAVRPTLEPLLTNLSNLSRTIAVTVVSRQPAHLAAAEVRLRRATALLGAVRARLQRFPTDVPTAQLVDILGHIEAQLPAIHHGLRTTISRAQERAAFSLELSDLRAVALRPLASALNLTWSIDPALVRFTYRCGVIMMIGVLAYQGLHLTHGYWVPFTSMVVLQPDYGSTRRRAGQRMLGTLGGSIGATLILWLHLGPMVLMLACAATIYAFGYWLRRNYGIAVIFITLFVVLLTEAAGPVSIELALERLGATLAGGLLALLAAHLFWPVWERERLPPIVIAALEANRDYLRVLVHRLMRGGTFDSETLAAKRRVERANANVFSSLNRLSGDPKNQREGLDYVATLANGNQRITRALNVLALHLPAPNSWPEAALARFIEDAGRAFTLVGDAVRGDVGRPATVNAALRALEDESIAAAPPDGSVRPLAFSQLMQVTTELCALLLAAQEAAPAVGARDAPVPQSA